MLFTGIPGYILEPDGNVSCIDCSVDFLLDNNYIPTDQVQEVNSVFNGTVRLRRWESSDMEDLWVRDLMDEQLGEES